MKFLLYRQATVIEVVRLGFKVASFCDLMLCRTAIYIPLFLIDFVPHLTRQNSWMSTVLHSKFFY